MTYIEWCEKNHPEQNYQFIYGGTVWNARQAEIDELKATIVKYEAGLRKNKANKNKLLSKNIELQKRIDKALEKLEGFNCPQEYGIEDIDDAIDILKGETNE